MKAKPTYSAELISPGCGCRQRLGCVNRDLDAAARCTRFLALAIVDQLLIPEPYHVDPVDRDIVTADHGGNHLLGPCATQTGVESLIPGLVRESHDRDEIAPLAAHLLAHLVQLALFTLLYPPLCHP